MTNTRPEDLSAAIQSELTIYAKDIQERVDTAGLKAIKELVKRTKATAPVGKSHAHFRDKIAYKVESDATASGMKRYLWYVKPPDHALTHLIVNGHQTRNGGRTKGNSFLQDALDEVLPQYQRDVEEAIKNE